ncbi:MAG TPA: hypothetical protein VER58_11455 [Thermoanaerobaculia bacterium]|nr:hypothetical protein [Thermoanaerobaculia bacterium]
MAGQDRKTIPRAGAASSSPLEHYITGALRAGLILQELRMSTRFEKIARVPYFLFMPWLKNR